MTVIAPFTSNGAPIPATDRYFSPMRETDVTAVGDAGFRRAPARRVMRQNQYDVYKVPVESAAEPVLGRIVPLPS